MGIKSKIGSGIVALSTLIGLVTTVISIVSYIESVNLCMDFIIYIAILFYAVVGYRRPHGNLLRYSMLLFAVDLIFALLASINLNVKTSIILFSLALILVGYVSGRLNKIESNKYLIVVILLILIAASSFNMPIYLASIKQEQTTIELYSIIANIYNCVIIWIALASGYFIRYSEHKEAGLSDN